MTYGRVAVLGEDDQGAPFAIIVANTDQAIERARKRIDDAGYDNLGTAYVECLANLPRLGDDND